MTRFRFRFRSNAASPSSPMAPTVTKRKIGPWVVGGASTVALTVIVVGKAIAASMVEYALLLVAVLLLAATVQTSPPRQEGFVKVLDQLQAASEGAARAHLNGDRHAELAGLAKTTGAVHALLGMTGSCEDCGDLRTDLQQISQIVLGLKDALRAAASCNPDGVVSTNEQCDPLADPTGCPIRTFPTFCDENCQCATALPTTVPCTFPFPAECDADCDCEPVP